MKYKTTDSLNIRSGADVNTPLIKQIPAGTVVEGEEHSWKKITLEDGTSGYCAVEYLAPVPETANASGWYLPIPQEYRVPSQGYLNVDRKLYPKFGYHTGVDYGGHGKTGIPLFACADGEITYRDIFGSVWGASLGNHVALYVPSVDKTFLYCHMDGEPHAKGIIKQGEQIGTMGNTGKSSGGAIHLHLEGFHGKFDIAWRSFSSVEDIKTKTFDADHFIRTKLGLI